MTTPAAKSLPLTESAPFLNWPVSRREFYRVLAMALLLTLTWGALIYGVRVIIMLGTSLIAATAMQAFLQRIIRWDRSKFLIYTHTVMSVLLLVALSLPTWPAWIVATAAALFPIIFSWIGGAGRERIHVSLAMVLLIQYAFLPALQGSTYTGKPDAVLARDRMLMGDIRDQHALIPGKAGPVTMGDWPSSLQLAGNDAWAAPMPAIAASRALDEVSSVLRARRLDESNRLTPQNRADIDGIFQRTFSFELPPLELVMTGVTSNRIGAASPIALLVAGVLLAYRYILRARSVMFFLAAFSAGTAAFMLTPSTISTIGMGTLLDLLRHYPGEAITLFQFLLLSSDAAFAAIILLALPRAEPLTSRGRSVYLLLVATGAAALHRVDPAAPAATLLIGLLTPLAPYFDRLFAARSWLHSKSLR